MCISPGWRSAAYNMLRNVREPIAPDDDAVFIFGPADVDALRLQRDTQRKGECEPPFDWADDIAAMFDKIIAEIEKRGRVEVMASW